MVTEKDKQMAETRKEMEKVMAECVDAKARALLAYKEEFEITPKYMQLSHQFMTACGKQLVGRIGETNPEWDISFLKYPHDDPPTIEGPAFAEVVSIAEPHNPSKAQTTPPTIGDGPQCANP
ncbi:hypothetical protein Adt_45743 [Abeliophyllum distichum]|uniref:Uncharacterized protein n=1 Tax=Abeliophyllum distichum TaxID=126358 RepID=A0ABD1PG12_9LAMI